MRLVQRVESRAQARDLVSGLAAGERRQTGGVDRVNARHDLAELARDLRARPGIGIVPQELARDRGAADAAHHEGLAQPVVGGELEQHFRRAHAALEGGPQDAEFGGAIERGGARLFAAANGRRIAAQDQRVAMTTHDRIEAPGLARGAARFAAKVFDARGSAEVTAAGSSKSSGDDLAHSPDCGIGLGAW